MTVAEDREIVAARDLLAAYARVYGLEADAAVPVEEIASSFLGLLIRDDALDEGAATAHIRKAASQLGEVAGACGGRVVKVIGAELFAVFPDAPEAAEAAIAMQRHRAAQPTGQLLGIARQLDQRRHRQRAGQQFGGAAAGGAVACHIIHVAVPPLRQPVREPAARLREIEAGHADRLEAQFGAPLPDAFLERCHDDGD